MMKKERVRCPWAVSADGIYEAYHDQEWGVPVFDDQKIFEFLVLESAQAGLSWITILRKRENYRRAFAQFNPQKIALFNSKDVSRLLLDAGIVRNRLKIEAAINNAKRYLEVQQEFEFFSKYIWSFVERKPLINRFKAIKEIPVKTKEAETLSADLKKRGFKFLGPTVIYAHMQATGMVNDHLVHCFRYQEVIVLHPRGVMKG